MKKIISHLLTVWMLIILAVLGIPANAQDHLSDTAVGSWTRSGYYLDENNNFLSVTWMDDVVEPGWYVGVMIGDVMTGWTIPQEGNTLHGNLNAWDDENTEPYIVTVSEEGEDGLMLAVEGGETFHFKPYDIPEATIFVSVNTEGRGNIDYGEGEEAPVIDPEYPFQSAQINLAEPADYTFVAWTDEENRFVKWTKNGEDFSTEAQITVLLDESADFVAVFDPVNPPEGAEINYLVLVNKLNQLPEDWEDALETIHTVNSLGDDVEVETKAYEAYLALKDALAQENVFVDLDSARRSVAVQQEIMDHFIAEYGADYAAKTVAAPGFSEHHTGLALDLYLNIDGQDVYYNEDMIRYPEVWAKVHEKLADYGFILRYPEGKEHITGYGYEPWHIRYIDDPVIAREIMDKGITLEGYLGVLTETDPLIDYGTSELFTRSELEEAAVQIKCMFASWEGCELHSLRYAGDESNTAENLAWLNSLNDGNAVKCAEFLADFHSPVEPVGAWNPDHEYKDYQWWLVQNEEGGWEILSWGY
ncbi:MAG: M15 family metallopeptidase [Flexilinea sp.]|nr:M15 family metallopeptidase [Flexilinea sp.]